MKKILNVIIVSVIYVMFFKCQNNILYLELQKPWYCIDLLFLYFLSFLFSLLNIFLLKKHTLLLYLIICFQILFFTVTNINLVLLMTYFIVLLGSYETVIMCKEESELSYLTIGNLFFSGYLLLITQIICIIN